MVLAENICVQGDAETGKFLGFGLVLIQFTGEFAVCVVRQKLKN